MTIGNAGGGWGSGRGTWVNRTTTDLLSMLKSPETIVNPAAATEAVFSKKPMVLQLGSDTTIKCSSRTGSAL